MSGPKTSKYTLTQEQQMNIKDQNRCDSDINSGICHIRKISSQLVAEIGKIELFENTGSEDTIIKTRELKNLLHDIEIKRLQLKSDFSSVSGYRRSVNVVPSIKALAEKEAILANVNKVKKTADTLIREMENIKEIADRIRKDVICEIEKNFPDSTNLSWDLNEKASKEFLLRTSVSETLESLLKMELSAELWEKVNVASNKFNTITNYEYLHNFYVITLMPLVNECKHYVEVKSNLGNKFEDLNYKYISLCNLLGIEGKTFILSKEGYENLKKEVMHLEEELYEMQEQEYIADVIDEVMEDMGYILIGNRDVAKSDGKRFRDEIYTFTEGTVINIRYDNDGKIAMELGGTDTTDRLPTESEVARLCDNMADFCNKFTEFEKRLAEKGVICKDRLAHFPPTSEYAQIINTSDYTPVQCETKRKTQRKTAKSKRLYKKEE